jgi:hypothetical protein
MKRHHADPMGIVPARMSKTNLAAGEAWKNDHSYRIAALALE